MELVARGPKPTLVGDFNCVVRACDVEGDVGHRRSEDLNDLVRGLGLVDAWRERNVGVRDYTWRRQGCGASRLDRVYLPLEVFGNLVEVEHVASLSDHDAVMWKVKLSRDGEGGQGPGVGRSQLPWKMNTAILAEQDFWENFGELWEMLQGVRGNFGEVIDWWEEEVKPSVKELCVAYSSLRSRAREATRDYLYGTLALDLRDGNWDQVGLVRARLKTMYMEDVLGFAVRSRFQENLEEERAGLFHLNRERKNGQGGNVEKLVRKGVDGVTTVLDRREDVESEVLGFFEPLFSGHHGRGWGEGGEHWDSFCV